MTVNFRSIQFSIIALAFVLIGSGVGLFLLVGLPFTQQLLRDEVAARQLFIANYMAREISQDISDRRQLIGQLAASLPPALLHRRAALTAWLAERQQINPLFNSGLLVIPLKGRGLLAGYPTVPGLETLDYSGRPWFKNALRAGQPIVSAPERGRVRGRPQIVMAAPVRDARHRVVAVLAGIAMIDSQGFLDDLHNPHVGVAGQFLLIAPALDQIVDASNTALVLQPSRPLGVDALLTRVRAGGSGTGITVNDGIRELTALTPVPGTDWFLVARMATNDAFRLIVFLRDFVLTFGLLCLIGVLAALLYLLPRILQPLTRTARAIREMAAGQRELTPLPVQRQDEVGSLVTGFNALVARLHTQDAALQASQERMRFMAHHDSLTGLCNRAMLEDRLQQALAHAGRNGAHFALLFCDLDGFKPINDRYGHEVGDLVLARVAARLLAGRRQTDTVARLGGDEFVLLVTGLDDARTDAAHLAQQCLDRLAAPVQTGDLSLSISASIGIALYQGGTVSGSSLLSAADFAMYQAKRAGKNRFCFFAADMADSATDPRVSALPPDRPEPGHA